MLRQTWRSDQTDLDPSKYRSVVQSTARMVTSDKCAPEEPRVGFISASPCLSWDADVSISDAAHEPCRAKAEGGPALTKNDRHPCHCCSVPIRPSGSRRAGPGSILTKLSALRSSADPERQHPTARTPRTRRKEAQRGGDIDILCRALRVAIAQ